MAAEAFNATHATHAGAHALPHRPGNIPDELKALNRWITFKVVPNGNKLDKIPYIGATNQDAKCNDPRTWISFQAALQAAEATNRYLGFAFTPDLPYTFLDFDKVVGANGIVKEYASKVIETLGSYTEASVSGDGMHVIARGRPPANFSKTGVRGKVEVYPQSGGRFALLTGLTRPGLGNEDREIVDCDDRLADLFPQEAPRRLASVPRDRQDALRLTDDEIQLLSDAVQSARIDGQMHHVDLAFAGYCAKNGVPEDQTLQIIDTLSGGERKALNAVRDSYRAVESGDEVSGYRTLQELMPAEALATVESTLARFWEARQPKIALRSRGHLQVVESGSETEIADVPAFPLEVLPPVVQSFVASASQAIGCPADFVAIPALALAEGAMGKSRRLVVYPGFEVSPGSWYGVIADPGTGKSPGLKYAMRLVEPLQQEAWDEFRYKLDKWEDTPKDERGEKPQPEHFYVTDATGEALWASLNSSPGVTQVEDELRRRLKALDAYRAAGDRQAMLGLWSNAPVKIVRRTSTPVYIPFPVAPLVGGIQPGVLKHLRGEGEDAEADDGWVPRFLLAWPDAEPLKLPDTPFDAATLDPAVDVFRQLRLYVDKPRNTALSRDAFGLFREWHNGNRQEQIASRGIERQWAAKAPFHLARLALVLHLLAEADEGVLLEEQTMSDAIGLLEYFREHLARVLPAFGASGASARQIRIIRIIRTSKHREEAGWVSRSDIFNGLRNVSPEDMTAALESLERERKVEREIRPTSRKPSEWWRLATEESGL